MSTGIGEALRSAREGQGRSLEDAAQALRARAEQLRALENEQFDVFPGEVYAKGFLRSYALWLGLDPQPLLDTFRAEVSVEHDLRASTLVTGTPPAGPRRTTPPAWVAWLLVAVVVVAGLGYLGMIGGGFAPSTAPPDEPLGPPPPPADPDPPAQPGPDADPCEWDASLPEDHPDCVEPEPEPIFEGVEVLLALEEASWLRVIVDGAVVLERTVAAGETLQYRGDSEVLVRYGNAGGVRVQVNGEDRGAPGGRGQVREERYPADADTDASTV